MDSKSLRAELRGKILPAVPVPFDRAGTIDAELQGQYITWMNQQDVGGIATWAHTGRGLWLSDDERASILQAWRVGCPTKRLICGVGVPHATNLPTGAAARTSRVLTATVAMAEQAKMGGADMFLLYPPRWLATLPDAEKRMLDYHTAVADVGLPVLAFYLYEAAGGVSFSLPFVESILDITNVVGIKIATLDSVMTFQDLAGRLASCDTLLITGEDRFLGYSFTLGAEAALVGIAAAATDRCVGLIDAWMGRDHERFADESSAMDVFAMATFHAPMEGYVQRMLWAAEAAGVFAREAFDRAAPPMPKTERAQVRTALEQLRAR